MEKNQKDSPFSSHSSNFPLNYPHSNPFIDDPIDQLEHLSFPELHDPNEENLHTNIFLIKNEIIEKDLLIKKIAKLEKLNSELEINNKELIKENINLKLKENNLCERFKNEIKSIQMLNEQLKEDLRIKNIESSSDTNTKILNLQQKIRNMHKTIRERNEEIIKKNQIIEKLKENNHNNSFCSDYGIISKEKNNYDKINEKIEIFQKKEENIFNENLEKKSENLENNDKIFIEENNDLNNMNIIMRKEETRRKNQRIIYKILKIKKNLNKINIKIDTKANKEEINNKIKQENIHLKQELEDIIIKKILSNEIIDIFIEKIKEKNQNLLFEIPKKIENITTNENINTIQEEIIEKKEINIVNNRKNIEKIDKIIIKTQENKEKIPILKSPTIKIEPFDNKQNKTNNNNVDDYSIKIKKKSPKKIKIPEKTDIFLKITEFFNSNQKFSEQNSIKIYLDLFFEFYLNPFVYQTIINKNSNETINVKILDFINFFLEISKNPIFTTIFIAKIKEISNSQYSITIFNILNDFITKISNEKIKELLIFLKNLQNIVFSKEINSFIWIKKEKELNNISEKTSFFVFLRDFLTDIDILPLFTELESLENQIKFPNSTINPIFFYRNSQMLSPFSFCLKNDLNSLILLLIMKIIRNINEKKLFFMFLIDFIKLFQIENNTNLLNSLYIIIISNINWLKPEKSIKTSEKIYKIDDFLLKSNDFSPENQENNQNLILVIHYISVIIIEEFLTYDQIEIKQNKFLQKELIYKANFILISLYYLLENEISFTLLLNIFNKNKINENLIKFYSNFIEQKPIFQENMMNVNLKMPISQFFSTLLVQEYTILFETQLKTWDFHIFSNEKSIFLKNFPFDLNDLLNSMNLLSIYRGFQLNGIFILFSNFKGFLINKKFNNTLQKGLALVCLDLIFKNIEENKDFNNIYRNLESQFYDIVNNITFQNNDLSLNNKTSDFYDEFFCFFYLKKKWMFDLATFLNENQEQLNKRLVKLLKIII